MNDDGFYSFQTLLIILFVSIIALSTGTGVSFTIILLDKNTRNREERALLQNEVSEIIKHFYKDLSPEADSAFDPVWAYIDEKRGIYRKLQLTDISSRVNINAVHPLFIQRTDLKSLLKNGVTVEDFRALRNSTGPWTCSSGGFNGIFQKEAAERYFTCFGLMNVNTAYEFSLQKMFELLTGDRGAAEVFHTFIADSLQKKKLITAEELSSVFKNYMPVISPLIGTEPDMNINFVPDFILRAILDYPYGGRTLKNKSEILEDILSARSTGEIDTAELRGLVKIESKAQEKIFQYLGTKTRFWEIDMETEKSAACAVVVCIPDSNEYSLYSFSITPIH